jgi:hypothetical protein
MERTKKQNIKEELLEQGVEKLQRFGFVNVNKQNISIDEVYSLYFLKILNEMLGENLEKDIAIKELKQIIRKRIMEINHLENGL